MNIKITYKWLLDYLDTDADAYDLQKYLSLCGPSVETVEEIGDDYVLDIEITSNRVDMASVFGIAQEAQAILPQFGKKAVLKQNPLKDFTLKTLEGMSTNDLPLEVKLTDSSLGTRITGMIVSGVSVAPSSDVIRQRLEACDVRSINNVVDISNYIMMSLGQPVHTFDYDKIKDHLMIIRKSTKDEKLTTLDGKEITLPGEDIVIEDGTGNLIDLAGIMGGQNTEITNETTNVLIFMETWNKKLIRKTSMLTGQRTMAATYFEKGLEPERITPAMVYGVNLLMSEAHGKTVSKFYDIYPSPADTTSISIQLTDITRTMGFALTSAACATILEHLGFGVDTTGETLHIMVPSWRSHDIKIKEDIIEEVARVYGYHNIPAEVQLTGHIKQPEREEILFAGQTKIKSYLKHLGLHEVMNYSMVSEQMLQAFEEKSERFLQITNPISEDLKYLRTSLVPSLAKNIVDNKGRRGAVQLFEIAKTYIRKNEGLPEELFKLGIAVNTTFSDLKGIIEGILTELNVKEFQIRPIEANHKYLSAGTAAFMTVNGEISAHFGKLKTQIANAIGSDTDIYVAEIDFEVLLRQGRLLPTYKAPSQYAMIKFDLNIQINDKPYAEIVEEAYKQSSYLEQVELVSTYNDTMTLRFYFTSRERNMTEEEAKAELDKISNTIKK